MEEVSGILLFHIQLMIVINHKLIGQCQIVTVGIYLLGSNGSMIISSPICRTISLPDKIICASCLPD